MDDKEQRPKTVLEVLGDRWCRDFPRIADKEGPLQVHEWNDDAKWFAAAYAELLRNAGHEIASDFLRNISESMQ